MNTFKILFFSSFLLISAYSEELSFLLKQDHNLNLPGTKEKYINKINDNMEINLFFKDRIHELIDFLYKKELIIKTNEEEKNIKITFKDVDWITFTDKLHKINGEVSFTDHPGRIEIETIKALKELDEARRKTENILD